MTILSTPTRAIPVAGPDLADLDVMVGRPGGSWIFDRPELVPAVWGNRDEVAWSEGEALMIVGTDGAGKTVLAHNLMVRMIGIDTRPLLGFTVMPRTRILYLSQDRPSQAARAFRRLVGEIDRGELDRALKVIDWPIEPLDVNPRHLLELAELNDCDTIFVDSVKDVLTEPSAERSGQALKQACQIAITGGVEVCLLHHDRKQSQESKRRLLKLSDVYGSRFLTAGCGSVIALNGGSGDPVIELRHLKQPLAEVGPLRVKFDFETGEVDLFEGSDLLAIIQGGPLGGITPNDAARILYETEKPTNAERERARRKLKGLVAEDLLTEHPGHGSDPAKFDVRNRIFVGSIDLTEPLTLLSHDRPHEEDSE